MNTELLDRIEELAGPQRARTFRAAAEFILFHNCRSIVESGCYRGNPADGQSTLILALLAKELGGEVDSVDLNRSSIDMATALLKAQPEHQLEGWVRFSECDSVLSICHFEPPIRFAYLDSHDHEASNPGPCQRHQLAEVGAIYGKMMAPCAILLDDNIPGTGGKTALSAAFLRDRGWTLAAEAYQILFTKL
jgi:hypothetical protein